MSDTIGWGDLMAWAGRFDAASRALLLDALARAGHAEREQVLVAKVGEVLAHDDTDRAAVVVVFGTGGWDFAYLDHMADVLYADGSTDEIDFGDVAELLAHEFGQRRNTFGVSVHLRNGRVDAADDITILFDTYGFPPRSHLATAG